MNKLRSKLKGWSADFKAELKAFKLKLINDITSLELLMEHRDLSDEEISTFLFQK
jgi:hypothetical protein